MTQYPAERHTCEDPDVVCHACAFEAAGRAIDRAAFVHTDPTIWISDWDEWSSPDDARDWVMRICLAVALVALIALCVMMIPLQGDMPMK